jgi:hypothetical protein
MADINVALEDRAEKYWETARVLRVVGWTSIVWGCGIVIYVWTGLKAGSNLWLLWTIGQFVAGAICLALSAWFNHLGAMTFANMGLKVEHRRKAA